MKTLISLAGGLLAASLTAVSGIGAVPAQAQTIASRSVEVRYADLDLGTDAGRRALDLRISHAVNALCGDASPADLRGQNSARACREELRAEASAQREIALASAGRGAAVTIAARR